MTVQQVYDMAIHLMDEQNETSGETRTVDTQEYQFRTISILNTVIPELYPYSSNFGKDQSEGRPIPPLLKADSYRNPDFTQEIGLDEAITAALLPQYLAAQLLSAENDALAQWFLNLYRTAYYRVTAQGTGRFEKIPTPYGLF